MLTFLRIRAMKLQYSDSSQQSRQLLQKYSCCCFAVLWGVMYLPAHIVVCTCSNEMSIKCIWEAYILTFKSQSESTHGQKSDVKRWALSFPRTCFPKGSTDSSLKWRWEGSAAFDRSLVLVSVISQKPYSSASDSTFILRRTGLPPVSINCLERHRQWILSLSAWYPQRKETVEQILWRKEFEYSHI